MENSLTQIHGEITGALLEPLSYARLKESNVIITGNLMELQSRKLTAKKEYLINVSNLFQLTLKDSFLLMDPSVIG